MEEIVPGLWRWTAPHPACAAGAEPDSPDDWDQYVGSVLYEDRDAAVFIDPLVPGDEDQFWSWADERVAGRNVVVSTTSARIGEVVSKSPSAGPPLVERSTTLLSCG